MFKTIILVVALAGAVAFLVYEITGLVPAVRKFVKAKKEKAAVSAAPVETEEENDETNE